MRKTLFITLILYIIYPDAGRAQKIDTVSLQRLFDTATVSQTADYLIDNFYTIYSASFQQADTLMEWVIETSSDKGWPERKAYGLLYKGVVNFLSGDYEPAIQRYLSALSIFDSLKSYRGLGRTQNEMAVFYHKTRDFDKALKTLDQAYENCRKAGDRTGMGTALAHQAAFLMVDGKYDEAKPYLDSVLVIRTETNDSVGLGYSYMDLAEYEMQKGRLEKSNQLIGKSTEIRKRIGDHQGVVINTVTIGENYFAVGKYSKAIACFQQGAQAARQLGYSDLLRFSYDMLGKAYVAIGAYREAFENEILSRQLKDSIFDIQKAKTISELETKYETATKENKIARQELQLTEQHAQIQRNILLISGLSVIIFLLVVIYFLSRNRFRKKQELLLHEQKVRLRDLQLKAALDTQESERRRFAEDLHDGFGQLVSSLRLNVASIRMQDGSQENDKAIVQSDIILNEMQKEIRNVAFNLSPNVLVKSGLVPAVKEFASRISSSGQLKIEVGSFELEERLQDVLEISLYRVIQEWVNNIVKYADASKVDIQFVRHNEELSIVIEDDGNGFDTGILKNGKGNGWRNIQSRLSLIRAGCEVDSLAGRRGTTFIIQVPMPESE